MSKIQHAYSLLKRFHFKVVPALIGLPYHLSDGTRTFLCPPDYGPLFQFEVGWEKEVTSVIANTPGLFLDVGANIGKHSVFSSNLGNEVIAIEPNPYVYECLEFNMKVNKCQNYSLKQIAAWNKKESLAFHLGNHSGMGSVEKQTSKDKLIVDADTLDSILEGRLPNLIKIDVEGAQSEVFQGLARTLKNKRIPIIFEANDINELKISIEGLNGFGYGIRQLDPINFLARANHHV